MRVETHGPNKAHLDHGWHLRPRLCVCEKTTSPNTPQLGMSMKRKTTLLWSMFFADRIDHLRRVI